MKSNIILHSFGASIRKDNGLFQVTTADGKQNISPNDIGSISISKGARISSDAVLLAIEHEIDVLFIDNIGNPAGRVWSVKYGSISVIRRKQLEFFYSDQALKWVKEIIIEKMNNQVAMLLALKINLDEPGKRRLSAAINSIEDHKQKVRKSEGETVADLAPSIRGWEGAASRKYFESLSFCLPDQYSFDKRSRQPAGDKFNAMLNYGYGMLYGKIEGSLIKAGLDPYAGIFHRDDYNRPALVFDVIEKFRVWVDYVILHLCMQDAMSDECFSQENGQVLLDGLGKRIVIQSVNDYLAEIIKISGLERSRAEHINLFSHKLATFFKEFKN